MESTVADEPFDLECPHFPHFEETVPGGLGHPSAFAQIEQPFMAELGRSGRLYARMDLLKPAFVKFLMGTDGRGHDDGQSEAAVKNQFAGLGPQHVGTAEAGIEFVKIEERIGVENDLQPLVELAVKTKAVDLL